MTSEKTLGQVAAEGFTVGYDAERAMTDDPQEIEAVERDAWQAAAVAVAARLGVNLYGAQIATWEVLGLRQRAVIEAAKAQEAAWSQMMKAAQCQYRRAEGIWKRACNATVTAVRALEEQEKRDG